MESKIVKKLVDELNMYRNAYYNDNISLISDKQYDLWGCGHILGLFYAANPRLCLYSIGLI